MIRIENTEVTGLNAAIRGMRNPMNSWDKSDSSATGCDDEDYLLGYNDHELAMCLVNGGPVHAKFRRMIIVTFDITAPLYWWKEFDTYKVGTVRNSCSTMHKIHSRPIIADDFSCEHLTYTSREALYDLVRLINEYREDFVKDNLKEDWWQIIQLLPSSYNQRSTVQVNYEVLAGMYKYRKDHKLDEWREFCKWIETLPYAELITGEK